MLIFSKIFKQSSDILGDFNVLRSLNFLYFSVLWNKRSVLKFPGQNFGLVDRGIYCCCVAERIKKHRILENLNISIHYLILMCTITLLIKCYISFIYYHFFFFFFDKTSCLAGLLLDSWEIFDFFSFFLEDFFFLVVLSFILRE